MPATKTPSTRARRAGKKIERSILLSKREAAFTRTMDIFEFDTEVPAKRYAKPVEKEVRTFDLAAALPKVAHLVIARNVNIATVRAIMAHYKQETGAVPVIHYPSRLHQVEIPSCLGAFGNVIDSGRV